MSTQHNTRHSKIGARLMRRATLFTLLAALATSTSAGCGGAFTGDAVLAAVYMELKSGAKPKLHEYKGKLRKAKREKRYEKGVTRFKKNIQAAKAETKKHLDAGRFAAGMDALMKLYGLTHPCGEKDCGTHPRPRGRNRGTIKRFNIREVMLEREGIDTERDFILASVERAYALTKKEEAAGKYSALDITLGKYAAKIPGPEANRAKFKKRHRELENNWIKRLTTRASKASRAHPGAALLYLTKARQLRERQKDTSSARKLTARIRGLRRQLIQQHGYSVAASGRGPHADEFITHLRRRSWPGQLRIVTGGKARASLTLNTSSPRYSRSSGSTTSSFRYVASRRMVTNRAWSSKKKECANHRSKASDYQRRCQIGSAGDPTRECDWAKSERERASRCDSRLSSIPRQVEQKVYDRKEYPVRLDHLDTSMTVGAQLTHADRRSALSVGSRSVRLTDRSHGAYSRNGSGVGRDARTPPSNSAGLSKLKSEVKGSLSSTVQRSFDGYRQKILTRPARTRDAGLHNAVLYALLQPGKLSGDFKKRLVQTSDMRDAVSLVPLMLK